MFARLWGDAGLLCAVIWGSGRMRVEAVGVKQCHAAVHSTSITRTFFLLQSLNLIYSANIHLLRLVLLTGEIIQGLHG